MSSSLDPFPDLCLIAIFLNLPLSDLFTVVGLVCSRWYGLLPTVLARRRTLKIVQTDLVHEPIAELVHNVRGDDDSPWAVRPQINPRYLVVVPVVGAQQLITRPFADALIASLANITDLSVTQHVGNRFVSEAITQVARLLTHWQDSLVSLTLSITNDAQVVPHYQIPRGSLELPMKNLLDTINRMRSLRHLKIDFFYFMVNLQHEMPIFSQLHSLNIRRCRSYDMFIRSIQQYANPDILTQVSFGYSMSLYELNGRFSAQLASKFTYVNLIQGHLIGVGQESLKMFDTFCSKFTFVHRLQMQLMDYSLHMIVPSLAKLQHLCQIHMILNPSDYDDLNMELPQITSLRSLSIQLNSNSHKYLETLQLPHLFPNVQHFYMYHSSLFCLDCGYDERQPLVDGEPIRQVWSIVDKCKRLARQELTKFTKLRTINLNQMPGTSGGIYRRHRFDIINSLEQL